MWTKYSHLDMYHFLKALEDQGVDPNVIVYTRNLFDEASYSKEDSEETINSLEGKLRSAEDENTELFDTINNLKDELKEQNDFVIKLERHIDIMNEDVIRLNAIISELEKQL